MTSYGSLAAFGGMRFLKKGHADIDDPHYKGSWIRIIFS